MEYVFTLKHEYRYDNDPIEFKFIGIFSSIKKAKVIIKKLSILPGFEDFPISCFIITKIKVDENSMIAGHSTSD